MDPVELTPPDNVTLTVDETAPASSDLPVQDAPSQMKLSDIPITNENIALNVMISFLNVAQKRGAFSFDESAKIWECIQVFVKASATASSSTPSGAV